MYLTKCKLQKKNTKYTFLFEIIFFFNWDSFHARLDSHYKAWWSYKKKKHKKIKAQEICLKEPPTVMLILESNWLHFDKEGPAVLHIRICSLFKDSK